jgi:hypothetical protein
MAGAAHPRCLPLWIAGRAIGDCRFDFILVTPYQIPVHIENAFDADVDVGA